MCAKQNATMTCRTTDGSLWCVIVFTGILAWSGCGRESPSPRVSTESPSSGVPAPSPPPQVTAIALSPRAGTGPTTSLDTVSETDFAYAMARLGPRTDPKLAPVQRKVETWQRAAQAGQVGQGQAATPGRSELGTATMGTRSSLANAFAVASDAIHSAAAERHVQSKVAIKTEPNAKAAVKYQTYGERQRGNPPATTKGLTPCTEAMLIGWYYIWSERQGKKTSNDGQLYKILEPNETVELWESDGSP